MINIQNKIFKKKDRNRKGFTLVEMMVVITVTAILSGLMISFGQTSRAQINLLKEGAKVIQVVSRAKALSLETQNFDVGTGNVFCGYGARVTDNKTYQIFTLFLRGGVKSDCAAGEFPSGPNAIEGEFKEYTLGAGIFFSGNSINRKVLFIPPRPYVKFSGLGLELEQNSITFDIQSETGELSRSISVNSVGQVSITD